jgi:hypothetical protein
MSRMSDYCDIQCDSCGTWEPGHYRYTVSQRRYLRLNKGWVYREGKDLCPVCKKENKTKENP